MSGPATRANKHWASTGRAIDGPDKRCPACGAAFFTHVGLAEHTREGCGNGHGSPVTIRHSRPTPAQALTQREAGLRVTARNNARRVRCGGCGKVSTPSGVAEHQLATGHSGRTELT